VVQFLDERIHNAHGVVLSDEVVEALRQQGDLTSIFPLDESLHVVVRSVALPQFRRSPRFHTGSLRSCHLAADGCSS
jgi:hypothetical protein